VVVVVVAVVVATVVQALVAVVVAQWQQEHRDPFPRATMYGEQADHDDGDEPSQPPGDQQTSGDLHGHTLSAPGDLQY